MQRRRAKARLHAARAGCDNAELKSNLPLPYALWVTCRFSRRLKRMPPQWDPLFGDALSIPREESAGAR